MTKITGKSSHKKWREQRQTILAELIADRPHENWSWRAMAIAMQSHPVVAKAQPNYGHMTAKRDWLAIHDELKERREELASEYIDAQLELTEQLLEDIQEEYELLNSIDLEELEEKERAGFILQRIRAKKDLVASVDKLLQRQQTLVPMEVPRRLQVDNRSISINIDALLENYEKAKLASGEDIIEGELDD